MTTIHRIMALVLIAVLGATVAGVVLTSNWRAPAASSRGAKAGKEQAPPVDLQPLRTAQATARLAATPEEQRLAQDALRISDHEVDLAFQMALHEADDERVPADEKTRKLEERVARRQKRLDDARAQVAELTKLVAIAKGTRKDALQAQLNLALADEDSAQNSVEDAKVDLDRAGGDKKDRIQQTKDEHEAADHAGAAPTAADGSKSPAAALPPRGLLGKYQVWSALRAEQRELLQAQREAQAAVIALEQEHDDLAARVKTTDEETPAPGGSTAKPASQEESYALLAHSRHFTNEQKKLLGLNRRARQEEELSGIYAQWGGLVAVRGRTALHGLLLGVVALLFVVLVLLSIDGWSAHFFTKLKPERERLLTMRRVTRVAIQGAGVVVILLVVFGPPGQLGMFLGFAGAGLTIALKDFIVGFFGWFVLMGKNGIRVGDWVEINGVSGEVVEIGLFRTILLETGNWTDAGHPTGRRVTFVNSFAIERHYFNFSTTGQWLWDELSAVLPAGQNPYPVVDAIQKVVTRETAESARLAELEWAKGTRSRGMSGFSAAPAITVRPGSLGFELVVRSVTRANERHTLRARLYQAVVELMGGGRAPAAPQAETVPPATA